MNFSFRGDPLFVGDAATGREKELLLHEMGWRVVPIATAATACVSVSELGLGCISPLLELRAP